jgi:hypothetical protein
MRGTTVFKISFRKSDFISPTEPVTRIEWAVGCDGSECGCSVFDAEGNLLDIPPHFHLVESQEGAWTRSFAIGGELPA